MMHHSSSDSVPIPNLINLSPASSSPLRSVLDRPLHLASNPFIYTALIGYG